MKKTIALFSFLSLILYSSTLMNGQSLSNHIESATKEFLGDTHLRHALTGISVVRAQTRESVYQHNGEIGLAPGSTLKVITAASAYNQLGPDYTYETRLAYDGSIENGVLKGNLYLLGSGDPSFGSEHYSTTKAEAILEKWTTALNKAGIRHIEGRIVGDGSKFDTQSLPEKWIWEDIGNYYGAGSSGLNWRENQYRLNLEPGKKRGEKVKVLSSEPSLHGLTFINELKTGSENSGDQTYIFSAPYTSVAYLRGTAPANHPNFNVKGSVPEPALFAARNLKNHLTKTGIPVNGKSSSVRLLGNLGIEPPTDLTTLATHRSPSLTELNSRFLKKSVNLYGESLVKTIALDADQTVQTGEGIKLIKKHWKSKGIDDSTLHMLDGSGLSPSNRLTPNALTAVLAQSKKETWFKAYWENFPTIHNIRMKSGFIHGAIAYTGFLETESGESLMFSFMVNNFDGSPSKIRPKMFDFLDAIKKY